jgi:sugar-specific transcriptional regulator TrmB
MEILETLVEMGLSKQEAIVYLNTLKLGLSKASEIAQKSKIQRGASYYILKLLKEKGFVSEVIKSGIKYYSAASPNRIQELLDDERERKKELLTGISNELEELRQTSIDKPNIEVYEGEEGFKTITLKLLEKPNVNWRCYLSSKILDYKPYFHLGFRRRRKEKNISIRTITEDTHQLREIKEKDKEELRETRFMDKLFIGSDVMLYYILDDAIVIVKANEKEQIGIYIKEPELAKMQSNIFDCLWDGLEK